MANPVDREIQRLVKAAQAKDAKRPPTDEQRAQEWQKVLAGLVEAKA